MKADWVSVCEAHARILRRVAPLGPETVPLREARGRVLAEDLTSPLDLPPWANSGMDGFAVRAADVRGASPEAPRDLRVIDDIPAGGFPSRELEPGTAARVMTGAPTPVGADSVIRVEHTDGGTSVGGADARVLVLRDEDAGKNIRPRGEDVRAGQVVLRAGTPLGPAALGAAAAVGRERLRVVRRPLVALLTSGDELVDVDRFDEVLAGRRIVSSNSYSLAAQVEAAGADVRMLGIAADSPESLRGLIREAIGCDALVTSAGVSVGEHDYLREVLLGLGLEVDFWRVRMRPGSPLGFGRVAALGEIPWFGLPGNPVSSLVTSEVFVRPALLRMAGHTRIFPRAEPAELRDPYPARPGLTHFARVGLAEEGERRVATLTGPQGSGILMSMVDADALLVIAEDRAGATPGDVLPAIRLGDEPRLESPAYCASSSNQTRTLT